MEEKIENNPAKIMITAQYDGNTQPIVLSGETLEMKTLINQLLAVYGAKINYAKSNDTNELIIIGTLLIEAKLITKISGDYKGNSNAVVLHIEARPSEVFRTEYIPLDICRAVIAEYHSPANSTQAPAAMPEDMPGLGRK